MMVFWRTALFLCVAAAAGWAQTDSADVRSCDLWSLQGRYLLTISGTRPAPLIANGITATPGTIEQVTGLFVIVFDGRGGFTIPAPIIVKGALSGLFPDQPGSGTYTLDGDCTGRFSVNLPQLPGPLVNSMVVLNGGKQFRSVVVSPQPVMITVSAVKIE